LIGYTRLYISPLFYIGPIFKVCMLYHSSSVGTYSMKRNLSVYWGGESTTGKSYSLQTPGGSCVKYFLEWIGMSTSGVICGFPVFCSSKYSRVRMRFGFERWHALFQKSLVMKDFPTWWKHSFAVPRKWGQATRHKESYQFGNNNGSDARFVVFTVVQIPVLAGLWRCVVLWYDTDASDVCATSFFPSEPWRIRLGQWCFKNCFQNRLNNYFRCSLVYMTNLCFVNTFI
jgi:hypothetical protein